MDQVYACPQCSNIIVKSLGDEVKIRGKVMILKENQCFVVCKGCNTEVPIPLAFNQEDLSKSLSPFTLYINKNRNRR